MLLGRVFCLIVAPSLYRIRVKKLIELNPVEALLNKYTKVERTIYVIVVILSILGFISYVAICEFTDIIITITAFLLFLRGNLTYSLGRAN